MDRKVALITGGARGIGRAAGITLAADGWDIALCYRTSADDAQTAVAAIEAAGGRGLAVQCDVSDPEQAQNLVAQVEESWGRIDALINGAGPYHRVPLLKESVAGWQSMFDSNLHPVFYLSQAVAPGMQERGWGRIISFSMANADKYAANPSVTAHYIAKASVIILSKTLAKILAPKGITVNVISPGFINSGSAPEEELASMVKRIPAGYVGETDDAVGLIQFLLSDAAAYINGTNIHLSGAWGL